MSKKLLMNTNDSSLTDSIRCYDKEFTGSFITASDISPTNYIDTETIVETKNMREITEIWGNTTQDENDLSNIQSLGWWNENRKCYEFDILSTNANFFNKDDDSYNLNSGLLPSTWSDVGADVRLPKGTYYVNASNAHGGAKYNKIKKDGTKETQLVNPIIVDGDTDYIEVLLYRSDNTKTFEELIPTIIISRDTNELLYVPHQSHKTTISLPCQLQKVGNAADRLFWDDDKGKYVVEKKFASTVINETDTILNYAPNNTEDTSRFYVSTNLNPRGASRGQVLSDRFKYGNKEKNWCWLSPNNQIDFNIDTSIAPVGDVNAFKQWLKDNNVTAIYELATPQLIETNITSKIQLPTYPGTTHTFITDDTTDASKFTYEDKDVDILVGARPIEIFGNTIQDETDLSKIESLGVWNERRQGYEIDILSVNGYNHFDKNNKTTVGADHISNTFIEASEGERWTSSSGRSDGWLKFQTFDENKKLINNGFGNIQSNKLTVTIPVGVKYIKPVFSSVALNNAMTIKGDRILPYQDYVDILEHKTTILLPYQLQKVGNVADRLYWDSVKGRYVVEKNIGKTNIKDLKLRLVGVPSSTHERIFFYNPPDHAILGAPGHSQRMGFVKGLTTDQTSNNSENPVQFVVFHENEFKWYFPKTELPPDYNDNDVKQYAMDLMNLNDYEMYYLRKAPQLIETNITGKIKVPTYANKTHISFVSENGIDCSDSKVLVPYKELL